MADYVLQLSNVVVNLGIVVVGIKLIRHISRIEMKVELMWEAFRTKFLGEQK